MKSAPVSVPAVVPETFSLLTADDLHWFNEGTHFNLYDKLGAHAVTVGGVAGINFAVWAPNAEQVSVIGDFNNWQGDQHRLHPRGASGIWEGFLPGIGFGSLYKFRIKSRWNNYIVEKADPFGFRHETPPLTASVVTDLEYTWEDADWMATRGAKNRLSSPISIYEVHLGSWRRVPEEYNRPLTYREMAVQLADHVQQLGFTHVELMPITEHPFYGSWGYQTTGYFAPTSRYGGPQDFKYLVDYLHQRGIGVILDWVPSHFPNDEHGLGYFDGTHLFEHADPRQGFHPDWASLVFNYGRNEVRCFLMSSALFWLKEYHLDGIRVDAVASMLYLDYSRKAGEWIPNEYGGRENLEAISFLRKFNEEVYLRFPDVQTYAEESTAWPMVSRPAHVGGLGFGLKWDMGWMHDTLQYFHRGPVHRKYHHHQLTFRMVYAFNENFILPISHDEVVHGKGALMAKMPGDDWQKFANMRLLFAYMYGQPGKKLLFMGAELGQWTEWRHEESLAWHLLQFPPHAGLRQWIEMLNRTYREQPALHEGDCTPEGFEWIDCNDTDRGVYSFLRKGKKPEDQVIVVCNATPIPRYDYRVGAPHGGYWKELLNSDATEYGGSGIGNLGGIMADPWSFHGRPCSLNLTLPPLAAVFLKPDPTGLGRE